MSLADSEGARDATRSGSLPRRRRSVHHVVVDDADAPNQSKKEDRALLWNGGVGAMPKMTPMEQGHVADRKQG